MTEILVVDDHPMVHEILPQAVKKAFGDVRVQCATNLDEAFECAALDKKLQFALLDLSLPGCSGIEALVKFNEKYPDTKIVVFSATEDPNPYRLPSAPALSATSRRPRAPTCWSPRSGSSRPAANTSRHRSSPHYRHECRRANDRAPSGGSAQAIS